MLWLEIAPDIDLYSEYHGAVPGRKYRLDFAQVDTKVCIEINGRGRHQSFVGYARDMERYRLLAYEGWTVIPLCCQQVTLENLRPLAAYLRNRLAQLSNCSTQSEPPQA